MLQRAFTLVELLITVAIVCIIGATLAGTLLGGCSADWQKAEAEAKKFAENVPGATGKVTCSKKDTDRDGYCGCTVFRKEQVPLAIDCGCEKHCLNCAEGCKMVNPGKGLRTNVRVTN
jgi:prepilin-type N-terminal cleavage/methylation domain-containing protein